MKLKIGKKLQNSKQTSQDTNYQPQVIWGFGAFNVLLERSET